MQNKLGSIATIATIVVENLDQRITRGKLPQFIFDKLMYLAIKLISMFNF